MVIFTCNDKYVPVKSAYHVIDIEKYYPTVEIDSTSPLRIGDSVKMKQDTKTYDLVVLSSVYEQNYYTITLTFKKVFDVLKVSLPPVTGMFTVSELCNKLGLQCTQINDVKSYHSVSVTSIFKFLEYLSSSVLIKNGGTAKFCLTNSGEVACVDIVEKLSVKKQLVLASVLEENYDSSWWKNIPGNLLVYYSSAEVYELRKIEMDPSLPTLRAVLNDTTGKEWETFVQKYKSEFLYKKNTCHRIVVELKDSTPGIGVHVGINGSPIHGIISACRFPLPLKDEIKKTIVKIICPE